MRWVRLNRNQYKLALITGASSGLGLALAKALSSQCESLLLSSRTPCQPLPNAKWIECDLAKTRAPLLEVIQTQVPDLLINNAGFTTYGDCLDEFSSQKEIFTVNAEAPFELALEAARALKEKKKKGTILNIGSAASFFPFPAMAVYSASKAFLASFSQSLDEEMKPYGVRSLVALPGQIATPFAMRAAHNPHLKQPPCSMPIETAVRLLLRQLEQQTPYAVIDWKIRLATLLSHLAPRTFLANRFRKNLLSRKNPKDQ